MIKLTQQQAIQWAYEVGLINKEDYAPAFQLAHEVGLINKEDYAPAFMWSLAEDIQRFASLAYEAGRKDEREACVKVIEDYRIPVGNSPARELAFDWTYNALERIRDDIQERGQE